MANVQGLQAAVNAGQITGNTVQFAESLLRAANGRGLTQRQAYWVDRLVTQATQPAPVTATLPNAAAIYALFQTAGTRLKWPKIDLEAWGGQRVVFGKFGNRSKYAGQIKITDGGRYGVGVYFGRIDTEGTLYATQRTNEPVLHLINALAADPAGVAAEYGQRTGHCCFCSLPLTDERSLAVGYGPVCARNYNLAWGNRT